MQYIDEMLYVAVKLLLGIGLILFGILFAALGGWGIYVALAFGILGLIITVFTYFDGRDYYNKKKNDNDENSEEN